MENVLILIDKAPYGFEDAFSGFYVAIACLNQDTEVDVLLMGDGVYAALEDQNPGDGINYPSVGELAYLIFPERNLFVHRDSLKERGIEEDDLVEAAEIIDDEEIYEIIKLKTGKTAFMKI